jgi:hypothetical protein
MPRTTIRSEDITDGQVKAADLASGAVDTTGLEDDIALLGFKVAANGSLAKYDLADQTVDAFEDASGISAGDSTNEIRDAAGNYYSGSMTGSVLNAYTSGSSNWTCPAGVTDVEVLVVAAGGGAAGYAGGGGAGGVVYDESRTVVPTNTYAYSVGTGGAGDTYRFGGMGGDGGDSTFDTITADGGGGSSGYSAASNDGGSGGGGNGGYASAGGSGTQGDSGGGTGYGNDGGDGYGGAYYGGGGGGASAAGIAGNAVAGEGGEGGAGKLFAGFEAYGTTSGNVASSGSNGGYFGGGGGGSSVSAGTVGAGGVGGGGNGASGTSTGPAGMANTGGGGGGARDATGGAGGSGIVVIKQADAYNSMTLVSNSTTAETQPTKADLVMTYTNGAGSATIGTDLTAECSRDGGTTWTSFGLSSSSDQGDTGGHTILTAHDLDISSQPSGTSMQYRIKTLNQSVSKQTRIHAVSLGWS